MLARILPLCFLSTATALTCFNGTLEMSLCNNSTCGSCIGQACQVQSSRLMVTNIYSCLSTAPGAPYCNSSLETPVLLTTCTCSNGNYCNGQYCNPSYCPSNCQSNLCGSNANCYPSVCSTAPPPTTQTRTTSRNPITTRRTSPITTRRTSPITTRRTFPPSSTTPLPCVCGQGTFVLNFYETATLPRTPFPFSCKCSWVIQVPQGSQVHFEVFQVSLSSLDTLKFIDPRQNSIVIQTCSGYQACNSLTMSGDLALVELSSYNRLYHPSFFIRAAPNSFGPSPAPCVCGGTPLQQLTSNGATASVSSPGYPNLYPNNCNCQWQVKTVRDFRLKLTFNSVSLEFGSDKLCIYQTLSTPYPENLIKCCNKAGDCPVGSSLLIQNQAATIDFTSDGNQQELGFNVVFVANPVQPCDSNPCKKGACSNVGNSFQCRCPDGWSGRTCSAPACFYTLTNNGFYVLNVGFSGPIYGETFSLGRGGKRTFTALQGTKISLAAQAGRSTTISVVQCIRRDIICSGTSILGFSCVQS